MRELSLGIVPYLNVLPLLEGLDADFPEKNWIRATPRELAGLLRTGEVDLAVVSTFEGIRGSQDYTLVPQAAIGSDGPVRSVCLYSKVPLSRIQRVLLDYSSLTSSHLIRILLTELFGLAPEYENSSEPIGVDFDWHGDPHDAIAVIGDVALRWERQFPYVLDMGAAWKRLTGLPFVFAGWWVRPGLTLRPDEMDAFRRARRLGQRRIPAIVNRLPESTLSEFGGTRNLVDYLANSIRFELNTAELESLDLFRKKLISHGLLNSGTPPVTLSGERRHIQSFHSGKD